MSSEGVVKEEEGGGKGKNQRADSPVSFIVPENLFQHVNQSLHNGINKGMLMEILNEEPGKVWIAAVTMVCRNLLRVRYIGWPKEFWCDITKTTVHHIGWCRDSGMTIEPPSSIPIPQDDLIPDLKVALLDHVSVPEEAILNGGLSAMEKIDNGMKVEIRSEHNPYTYWIATIIENIGGRLRLKYDAPKNIDGDFWLFYTSPRLRQVGFCYGKGASHKLQHPKSAVYNKFEPAEWESCITSMNEANKIKPFPKSVIADDAEILPHYFDIGMKLETVNPANMREICSGHVAKVIDRFYFLVAIDKNDQDNEDIQYWLCHSGFPYIFPIGWAKSNNIEINSPPQTNTEALAALDYCFESQKNAYDLGFRINMQLEVADPEHPSNLSDATIVRIIENLLLVKIGYTGKSYWFTCDSLDIFPVGWCASNNVDLQKKYESHIPSQIQEDNCDRIYFNYKCYSGPFISKNKLSQLPKHVGPGPLSLVLREVLNMVISVAYKPGRLLKDWEWEGKQQPNIKLEVLKAKLKTNTHRANVQVVSKKDEVPSFCKEMCSKLQACPFLFGPTEITDQCPERCQLVNNKTKFRTFRKKRRRRGLHFMTVRARERRAALENENLSKDGAESGNESDQSLPSTPLHSESGTRPNTPDSNSDPSNKKPRKKREARTNIPPLEMKTRGAKLPNFALQMKRGHWNRKDAEVIYNNTCVVPRKQYSDDSESDNNSNSCNSNETKNNREIEHIFDVSDSEEPELKKLRVTPLHEPLRFDAKSFGYSDSSVSLQSTNCEGNTKLPTDLAEWTVDDVFKYLMQFENCRQIACKVKEEEIDGIAFIMLNYPTMLEHLNLTRDSAFALCSHVASLKLVYFT